MRAHVYKYLPLIDDMQKPCVIVIEYETRDLLKDVAKKSQTYDTIIRELISLKQNHDRNPSS